MFCQAKNLNYRYVVSPHWVSDKIFTKGVLLNTYLATVNS